MKINIVLKICNLVNNQVTSKKHLYNYSITILGILIGKYAKYPQIAVISIVIILLLNDIEATKL